MVTMENELKMIFVEGKDDKRVVSHIMRKANLEGSDNIVDKNGVDNLLKALSSEVKVSGRSAVGFVIDANDQPERKWESVVNRLRSGGICFPSSLSPEGTIMEGDPEKRLPRVGVWLMPYNDRKQGGELEDFVIEMIPKGDPVLPLAENYIDSINADDRTFPPNKRSKAVIHAWLATRTQPGQMGSAIERNELQINDELCEKFVNWIRRLFSES